MCTVRTVYYVTGAIDAKQWSTGYYGNSAMKNKDAMRTDIEEDDRDFSSGENVECFTHVRKNSNMDFIIIIVSPFVAVVIQWKCAITPCINGVNGTY